MRRVLFSSGRNRAPGIFWSPIALGGDSNGQQLAPSQGCGRACPPAARSPRLGLDYLGRGIRRGGLRGQRLVWLWFPEFRFPQRWFPRHSSRRCHRAVGSVCSAGFPRLPGCPGPQAVAGGSCTAGGTQPPGCSHQARVGCRRHSGGHGGRRGQRGIDGGHHRDHRDGTRARQGGQPDNGRRRHRFVGAAAACNACCARHSFAAASSVPVRQCRSLRCRFLRCRRRNCPQLPYREPRRRRRFPTPGGSRQILLRRHRPLRPRQLGRGPPLRGQEAVQGWQHRQKQQSRPCRPPAPGCRSPARASRWPSFR